MDKKEILKAFVELEAKFLPFPFNLFVGFVFDTLLKVLLNVSPERAAAALTFAAPDQLKAWLTTILNEAIAKVNRPILRRVLTMLVDSLAGPLLDALWDVVTGAKTVAEAKAAVHPAVSAEADTGPDADALVAEELAAVATA